MVKIFIGIIIQPWDSGITLACGRSWLKTLIAPMGKCNTSMGIQPTEFRRIIIYFTYQHSIYLK